MPRKEMNHFDISNQIKCSIKRRRNILIVGMLRMKNESEKYVYKHKMKKRIIFELENLMLWVSELMINFQLIYSDCYYLFSFLHMKIPRVFFISVIETIFSATNHQIYEIQQYFFRCFLYSHHAFASYF